jgi:hypothetical protein
MMALSAKRLDKWATRLVIIGFLGFLVMFIGGIVFIASSDLGGGDLDYDFEVLSEEALVTVKGDGSVDIDYTFVFRNHGDLDGVDVGLPNRHYDEASAWAYVEVDGERYSPREIRPSPYVEEGLAVELTDRCRRAAESGTPDVTIRFHVNNPHMVYVNQLREGSASVRFRPTWFGSDFQRGPTGEVVVRILGPAGHQDLNRTYYIKGMEPGSTYVTTDGRVMASWSFQDVDPQDLEDGDYDVGMAFPDSAVEETFERGFSDKAGDALHSAGSVCYAIWPFVGIAFFMALIMIGASIQDRSRRSEYFDPEVTVPGAGPRTDLLAVEAAVVMEMPMERLAAMILFGLQRKGLVNVDYTTEPITIEKFDEVGEHLYETRFLAAIRSEGRLSRKFLRGAMVKLVEDVEDKMKGFGLEATREHYRGVCERAWEDVEASGTEGILEGLLEEKNEWLMLDEDYDDHMDRFLIRGAAVASMGSTVAPDVRSMARDYVDRLRTASSHLVKDAGELTKDVTEVTHPVPVGSGGGVGGGCACACACACAGGGR